jgi:guanine deaminase
MIYGELYKPVGDRSIPSMQMLRAEAVEVWKKYKAKPDKVPY